jgi:hypothetical protein
MQHLRLERDGIELAAIPLDPAGLEIGSAPGNGLRLCGHGIRPFHAVLRLRQRRWWAVARGGAPLRLDDGGERPAAPLLPGTRVAVGPYRLEVFDESPDGAPAPLPSAHDRTRPIVEPTPRPGGLVLRWTGPDGRQTHRRLGPGVAVLGRHAGCDLVLDDSAVSARHARITVDDRGATLEDLASLNGCRLDGRRVFVAELLPGSTLELGGTELTVASAAAPDRPPTAGRLVPTPGLVPALELLRLAAPSREPCVLLGETGCGKEVLARRLHELGPRRGRPFVAINAGALPPELAESLLFGHERGAFTGAQDAHRGAFERADGGTLFLDELGEMRLDLQVKLLRVLEERAVLPVGAERPVPVDVRVVAATNREPGAAVRAGHLRLDLWHRLAVFVVHVPPLRARRRDIVALAETFLATAESGPTRFSEPALRALARHPWPGNVRELRNVVFRAALAARGPVVAEDDVRKALEAPLRPFDAPPPPNVTALLTAHDGNVTAAAQAAGLPRTTFRELLERRRRRGRGTDEPEERRSDERASPDGRSRRPGTRGAG